MTLSPQGSSRAACWALSLAGVCVVPLLRLLCPRRLAGECVHRAYASCIFEQLWTLSWEHRCGIVFFCVSSCVSRLHRRTDVAEGCRGILRKPRGCSKLCRSPAPGHLSHLPWVVQRHCCPLASLKVLCFYLFAQGNGQL